MKFSSLLLTVSLVALSGASLPATAAESDASTGASPQSPSTAAPSQNNAGLKSPPAGGNAKPADAKPAAGEAKEEAGTHETLEPKKHYWSFDGITGKVDKPSAQRGLQIYKEVCSACHSLNRVAFRSLADLGFSEGEIKALAASYTFQDGPNDAGEMFDRPGKPSDHFPPPYANEQAARAAQNGALPPDLSLIIKARHHGANYVYSLLTGYQDAPTGVEVPDGMHYNPYFPGGKLAMPAPLSDGKVEYTDGTNAGLEQEAHDVVNFLQWAAEPEMEARKLLGLKVLIYLAVFTGFMYVAKKRIWKRVND